MGNRKRKKLIEEILKMKKIPRGKHLWIIKWPSGRYTYEGFEINKDQMDLLKKFNKLIVMRPAKEMKGDHSD